MSRFLMQKDSSIWMNPRAGSEHLPSGTGPLFSDGDGVTARVRDIISNTDANEPRAREILAELTRLVLSSSRSRGLAGFALFSKVARESCVMGDSEERPGIFVRQLQKLSTTMTTNSAAAQSTPPSAQSRLLRKMSPRTSGWKARMVPRRRSSHI